MYWKTGNHTIRKIEDLGGTVILDDNSRWTIGFIDKTKSMMWMPPDQVTVSSYIGSKYKITHVKRNETVEATFIG